MNVQMKIWSSRKKEKANNERSLEVGRKILQEKNSAN